MGLNTTILILNDDIGKIDEDPVAWWKAIRHHIFDGGKPDHIHGAGGTRCVGMHHSSTYMIACIGGNTSEQIDIFSAYPDDVIQNIKQSKPKYD